MSWPPSKPPYTAAQAIRALQAKADAKRGDKPKAKRKTMELDFQEELVAVLRVVLIPPARVHFVPNGGNLSKVQRARFQKAGLTPGVHDLHLIWPCDDNGRYGGTGYGTLELKAGKGKASPEQDQFGSDLRACGHATMTIHAEIDGVEGALAVLEEWGVPMRSWSRGA